MSSITKILPLTELTGVRPGEEGKSPGSATKAKLKYTNVKGEKNVLPTINFLIYVVEYTLCLYTGAVKWMEEENAETGVYVWLR